MGLGRALILPAQPAMRLLGTALLAAGALIGTGVGIAMLLGLGVPGVSWLVAVGLTKLTLLAAGGLIAGGAVLQRLAKAAEDRERSGSGERRFLKGGQRG